MATASVTRSGQRHEDMGELFERYAPYAHRLAFLLLRDRDEASDVVQDAFVKLFARFRDLRRPEAFEWYLRRAVINLCRDHYRKIHAEQARNDRLKRLRHIQPDSPVVEPSPLVDLLGALPHRQKVAIVLRYYEDLSLEETAIAMRCSTSAVKSLVNRALRTLREVTETGDVIDG